MKNLVKSLMVALLVAAVAGGCGKDESSSVAAKDAANAATNKVEKAKKPKKNLRGNGFANSSKPSANSSLYSFFGE